MLVLGLIILLFVCFLYLFYWDIKINRREKNKERDSADDSNNIES